MYEQERYSDSARSWGQAALLQHGASHAFLSNMLFDGKPDVAKDLKRAFELAAASCSHPPLKPCCGAAFFSGNM